MDYFTLNANTTIQYPNGISLPVRHGLDMFIRDMEAVVGVKPKEIVPNSAGNQGFIMLRLKRNYFFGGIKMKWLYYTTLSIGCFYLLNVFFSAVPFLIVIGIQIFIMVLLAKWLVK
ncbi:hypothetical protein [Halalkalibacter urbisdiaboli]|uniref:hypothetical protein n=1 Tax=Halalkalibacter urbisdiaboli TaxID=1960589 RepID=UPI000B44D196|nr:hypothetical protein [Halalkalibacter urbisdiaboli]